MAQTILVWTHGGRKVCIAGSWNDWNPEPMEKHGNYFIKILSLPDGEHNYKYVVDGVWQYDLGQQHQDDGSGNWNNFIEIGGSQKSEQQHSQKGRGQQQQPQQQQQQQQGGGKKKGKQQQQPQKTPEPQHEPEQRPQKGKQQQQQQQQQQGGGKKKGRKQQQQQKTPEPAPEPEPEPEAVEEAQPVEESQPAEEEAQPVEESQPAEEEFFAPDVSFDTPSGEKKIAEAVVEIAVVTADVDTDLDELEKFVRGTKFQGLTWHGSKITDHVFGLKKLNIVCKCKEDVSVDAVCQLLEQNDLVGSAQIESFTC